MKAFDQHCQRARATADIEDTMSALDGRLIEKRPPCRIATKQFHEGIIERQRPIAASSRKVGSLNIVHGVRIPSVASQGTLILRNTRSQVAVTCIG
jgi:hypothetical protein